VALSFGSSGHNGKIEQENADHVKEKKKRRSTSTKVQVKILTMSFQANEKTKRYFVDSFKLAE
jgi:hypothetical protein